MTPGRCHRRVVARYQASWRTSMKCGARYVQAIFETVSVDFTDSVAGRTRPVGGFDPKALTLDQRNAHTDSAKISSSECCTRGLGFELSEASLSKYPFGGSKPMARVFHRMVPSAEW